MIDYYEYIESDAWREKRAAALSRAGHRCQLCGSRKRLNVHHNTYANLGNEKPEDLIVLCRPCHEAFHVKRDKRTSVKITITEDHSAACLPPPPRKSKQLPIPSAAEMLLPPSGTLTILIDEAYVESLVNPGKENKAKGITARGIRLLGETWPPKSGWAYRAIGRTVVVDAADLAAERERVSRKIYGPAAPTPDVGIVDCRVAKFRSPPQSHNQRRKAFREAMCEWVKQRDALVERLIRESGVSLQRAMNQATNMLELSRPARPKR